MININKYKDCILSIFSQDIKNYNLQFNEENENSILLSNEFCSLHFYCDFDKVECDLRLKGFDDEIPLTWIPIWGFGKKDFEELVDVGGLNKSIIYLQRQIIIKYIDSSFRNGESPWLVNYIKNRDLDKRRLKLMFSLSKNHAIYLKFKANDDTWRNDIDELLL